ncbi:MAG: hypothetical protein KDJ45_02485 [Hyphomicrobiaceae bacterium]|nr:hypothetical protein [Hyphomicrobiaceae bacterium]
MSMQPEQIELDDASANSLSDLTELASIVSAARDALSDDMVTRLSSALSEGMILLDRLTRNQGVMRLLQVLDKPESQKLLLSFADALSSMSRELASTEPSKGGLGGVLKLASDPGTQEGLRSLSTLGKYWSANLRDLNKGDG